MMHTWILAWTLLSTGTLAEHVDAEFEAGCQAFEQGNWDLAEAAFTNLRAKGLTSGWISYNLGNCQLKAGRLGDAIASYREALRELPRHSDVRANLAFARRRVSDAIAPVEPLALPRTLFFWHYVLNAREGLWVLGGWMALFWLARLGMVLNWQRRTLSAACVVGGLGALAQSSSLVVHRVYPTQLAVVTADEVDVRISNQVQAPTRFRLHAGCETQVHAQLDGWVLVALSDGKQGWVPRQSVTVVVL